MKRTGRISIALTLIACLAAMTMSVYPGVLNELLFTAALLSAVVAPVLGLIVLVMLLIPSVRGKVRIFRISRTQMVVVLALLLGSYVLLKFYVPRRVAFAASRAAFEQVIAQAPTPALGGIALNRRLGVYHVDKYAADPRGGVYFRVYAAADGPDRISYGFVFQPNVEGSPFGAKYYQLFTLGDGWYWFIASDDWF